MLDPDNNFCEISLSILFTCLVGNVWIYWGEGTCKSLLGVEGLTYRNTLTFDDVEDTCKLSKLFSIFFFLFIFSTFVCPTEIIAFSDRVQEFEAINCSVIACSVDSHFSHLAW